MGRFAIGNVLFGITEAMGFTEEMRNITYWLVTIKAKMEKYRINVI